mgnify:CR=1 FL=1
MMPKELENKFLLKSKIHFLLVLLFVYVILFEFILPFNNLLPKPSLLVESLVQIWQDYNLLSAIAITTTIIYTSLLIAYFINYVSAGTTIKIAIEFPETIEKLTLFKYFPAFFFAIIFSFWFGDSIWGEFLFALIASTLLVIVNLIAEIKDHNPVFAEVASNLGLNKNAVYSKVIFKDIQPIHFSNLVRIHYYLWVLLMIYEFISNINGLGGIYRSALMYRDFAGLFSIALVVSILILFGSDVIKFIKEKLFFWK